MRKFVLKWTAVGALGALAVLPLAALDEAQVARYEVDLAAQMTDNDAASLKAQAATLKTQLQTQPGDPVLKLRLGIVYHNLSRVRTAKDEVGFAGQAATLFDSLVKSQASEELKAFALAYLGSATTLRGNEDWNPAAKIGYVNDGFSSLDRAVDLYGQAGFLPRYLRANVALAVPDFFGKQNQAGDDLLALEARATAQPQRIPTEVQAGVEVMLGTWYKKNKKMDKAVAAWQKALVLDPQKKGPGLAAAQMLEIYGD